MLFLERAACQCICLLLIEQETMKQLKLKLQAAMNEPSQSTCVGSCCRWGVPCRRFQGNTLYMSEQFGVDGKLFVEVIMT